MRHPLLNAYADIVESLRAGWFIVYTVVFGGLVVVLFLDLIFLGIMIQEQPSAPGRSRGWVYPRNWSSPMRIVSGFLALSLLFMPLGNIVLAQTAADVVQISGAYVRALPPGAPNGVAFMTLHNSSEADQVLVGIRSSASRVTELHTHSQHEGMLRMRRVEQITVPAKSSVTLESGGLHMMLIGMYRDLAPDESVAIVLIFGDGSEARVQAPVRRLQVTGHGQMMRQHDQDTRQYEKARE